MWDQHAPCMNEHESYLATNTDRSFYGSQSQYEIVLEVNSQSDLDNL
jgi:hypothetical protein